MTPDTSSTAESPPVPRDWGKWLLSRSPVTLALVLVAFVGWSRWADWKRNELSRLLDGVESRYQFDDPDLLLPTRHRLWRRLMRSVRLAPPLVTHVNLSGAQFDDDWFRQHASKFAWREAVSLNLGSCPITLATIERISRWKNLDQFSLGTEIQGEAEFGRLGHFPRLTGLNAWGSLPPEVIAHIAGGGRLEYLSINGDRVTPEVVAAMSRNVRLTSLTIADVTDNALLELREFKPPTGKLNEMFLNNVHCTSAGIASLAQFSWARSVFLDLDADGLDAAAFGHLAACGNVSSLYLNGPTDETLRHLAAYQPRSNGQIIYLRRLRRTENTLELLKNLSRLPTLWIYDPVITDEEHAQLREALPNLRERR